ncbi:hypothetical protein HR060_03875 [Catenovulum sp. SM1970]|uniref:hypothetical protein n=1 Tax=Marinifaba aquimaris TaxID=2741323 RepID=UPI001573E72E|nr:hypothetical protein [Marinifaba aquimaris]NTS75997.1 hypothetical protein [Marinifaba aquimaris]
MLTIKKLVLAASIVAFGATANEEKVEVNPELIEFAKQTIELNIEAVKADIEKETTVKPVKLIVVDNYDVMNTTKATEIVAENNLEQIPF